MVVSVAVSRKEVSDSSVKVSDRTISFITDSLPCETVAISGSPWTVVQMKHTSQVRALITQKAVIEPGLNLMVVFRPILTTSGLNRVIQVKGLQRIEDWAEVKRKLYDAGVAVVSEDPEVTGWVPEYPERVIWKLRAPSVDWEVPTNVPLARGTTVFLLPSLLCNLCHSDDHHRKRCRWESVVNQYL